jgi:hypothetical protein
MAIDSSIHFVEHPARPQGLPSGTDRFRVWEMPDGKAWLEFFRVADGYLLRFPGFADFVLSAEGREVQGWPVPGASPSMFEHLYLNQVIPLALSRQGKLVLHAGAIETSAGAVAFAAPSGRGKSTLTASFASSGHRFITDDGLPLEWREGRLVAIPGDTSIRLLDDSRHALLRAHEAGPRDHRGKARVCAGSGLTHSAKPVVMRAIFFLGSGEASVPAITPMTPAQALIALVRHSFLLDVDESEMLAAHFGEMSQIAALPIHYHLDYPRRYEELRRVREAINDLALQPGPG